MWRTVATAVFAVGLGVAGALYVGGRGPFNGDLGSDRLLTVDPENAGWLRLPNGLRVIVRPIEGATQAAVLTYFRIGSVHDPEGRCGLAHLTEHLYAASAAGATPARTATEWQAKYGTANCAAQTDECGTLYFVKVPPSALEDEIADAAARMSDLRIEASDLDRERPRVLQQIAEHDSGTPSRPGPAGWTAAVRRLRPRRGGGEPRDVAATSLAEVREQARRFYRPANAYLVLTGAVDPSAVRLVARHFAQLPGGELAPPVTDRGPSGPGGRLDIDCGGIEPGAATERSVWIAWPGPSRDDPDSIETLLLERRAREPDDGRRLFSPLLWVADGVILMCWRGDEVSGHEAPRAESSVDDVIAAADALVARFAAEPPTAEEIDAISSMGALRGKLWDADAKYPEMHAFGLVDGASRHRDPDRVRRSLESLTKDDLVRFAAKWLDPKARVVSVARGPASPPVDDSKLPPYVKEIFEEMK